ncbi:PAS-domain containing protein [Sphaerotilus sp.]|uniref:PAS-domain containing protein n=1 Tax=Sphaerotilus sp. TaxID=2093942 RepID=UPI0025D10615|nr:PAS-domain containing protein [Sphaerotilus sp.]
MHPADTPESLREQQRHELLQAGLDLLDQGITVFDADLRMVAWNQAFLRLLDFPPALAHVGSPFESFIRFNAERGEYGPGAVDGLVAERLHQARAFQSHATERHRPNGQILAVRGEPLPHDGFVTLYTDITAQRRYEQLIREQNTELEHRVAERTAELQRSNDQLQAAQATHAHTQKMEAVVQLTGGLAHDFNNMLAVMIGNLAALRDRHPGDPDLAEFLTPALKAAHSGATLIRRLLAFARQQPLVAAPVEVDTLISDAVQLLRRSLPDTVRVVTAAAGGAPVLAWTDAHQLENALVNLALNARDAMPDGGELRIEARPVRLDAWAAAAVEVAPGDYVQITVSDTGIGMDSSTQVRVFEPFFTTKRFGSGSGLGLSMVYGFAKQSGGGVALHSRPGQGTVVRLVLPQTGSATPAHRLADPPDLVAPTPRRPLVLLVEDNGELRRVIRLQLVGMGYPVIEAGSGGEALKLLQTVPDIGLLISDIVMPGPIDGRELCQRTSLSHPGLHKLLISGYADERPAPWPLLRKPFSSSELGDALDQLDTPVNKRP